VEASLAEARSQRTTSEALLELERFEIRQRLARTERHRGERARRAAASLPPPQPPPAPPPLPPPPPLPTVVVAKRTDRDGKRALRIVRQLQLDTTKAVAELQSRVDQVAAKAGGAVQREVAAALQRARVAEASAAATEATLRRDIEVLGAKLKGALDALGASQGRILALEGDFTSCNLAVESQAHSLELVHDDNRQRLRHEKENYMNCTRNAATTRVVEADLNCLRDRLNAALRSVAVSSRGVAGAGGWTAEARPPGSPLLDDLNRKLRGYGL